MKLTDTQINFIFHAIPLVVMFGFLIAAMIK
jgi:hypothetical protein